MPKSLRKEPKSALIVHGREVTDPEELVEINRQLPGVLGWSKMWVPLKDLTPCDRRHYYREEKSLRAACKGKILDLLAEEYQRRQREQRG